MKCFHSCRSGGDGTGGVGSTRACPPHGAKDRNDRASVHDRSYSQ